MRTYEEAVQIMVDWWVEKSFRTLMNQNNGDDRSGILLNMVAARHLLHVNEDQILLFKKSLTDYLMEKKYANRNHTTLDKDYDPNKPLREACVDSIISPSCLPCKTFTRIDANNNVEGRYQYGGDWFKI